MSVQVPTCITPYRVLRFGYNCDLPFDRPEVINQSIKIVDPLNVEFERLLAKSGWTQSESARQLELTPAVITRYLNGETRPSLTTLKLFKLMLGDIAPLPHARSGERKSDLRPMEEWERDLLKEMRSLAPDTRAGLVSGFKKILNVMPRQSSVKRKRKR